MGQKLTPKLVRKLFPDQNSRDIERLDVSDREISEVGDLSTCQNLIRLDLSNNTVATLAFAATCPHLKWLSVAQNPITDLSPLQSLTQLQVLNVGHAKLAGKVKIIGMTTLGALILSDNEITAVSGLKHMGNLNTLVLKQNAIADLGSSLHKCTALAKLSMAHNQLASLGTALVNCTALKELRLNHNPIRELPAELSQNSQLRILDLGDTAIASLGAIRVLAKLPWLRNLNLKGCPLTQEAGYPDHVLSLVTTLEILDNKRINLRPAPGSRVNGAEAPAQHESIHAVVSDRADRTKTASSSRPQQDVGITPAGTQTARTQTKVEGAKQLKRKPAALGGNALMAEQHLGVQTREDEREAGQMLQEGFSVAKRELSVKRAKKAKKRSGSVAEQAQADLKPQQEAQVPTEQQMEATRGKLKPHKRRKDDVAGPSPAPKQEVNNINGGPAEKKTAEKTKVPVVGVYQGTALAGSKAVARGAQAAALLASEPTVLGAAWS